MILLNLNGRESRELDLFCPHCEMRMGDHDPQGGCPKSKLTRRFFLGGLGVAAAGAAVAKFLPDEAFAEKALENFEILAPAAQTSEILESAIFRAAPKVHRPGAIVVTTNYTMSPYEMQRLQAQADYNGVPVIAQNNPPRGVRGNQYQYEIHKFEPSKIAFEHKWNQQNRPLFDRASIRRARGRSSENKYMRLRFNPERLPA